MADLIVAFLGIGFGLFTLQYYVYKQINSRQHRLLAIVLVTMVLYCFYQVARFVTGADQVIDFLSQLLSVQLVYLCCHYLFDVMHLKIPLHVEVIMFITLIGANLISIFTYNTTSDTLLLLQKIYLYSYSTVVIAISIIEQIKRFVPSKRERHTVNMLYLGIMIVAVAVILKNHGNQSESLIVMSLIFGDMIVLYLFRGGYIKDDPYAKRISLKDFSEEEETVPHENTIVSTRDPLYIKELSHRMLTPLNAIIAFSDLLANKNNIDDENRGYSIRIKSAGSDLLDIVNGILSEKKAEKTAVTLDMAKDVLPEYIYPNARVLLVEDMEVNRAVFVAMCKQWEFAVDVALNGEQAVEMAKTTHYDMVFMDKMMPVMDGFEATKKIREFSFVPIIIITADVSTDLIVNYSQYGLNGFVTKPLEVTKLKEIIESKMPYTLAQVVPNMPQTNGPVLSDKVKLVFKKELSEVSSVLAGYFKEDISLFRTKVHGIKSVSKQMGYMDLGEEAEILEMAAKTENIAFIETHLDGFLNHCTEIIDSL